MPDHVNTKLHRVDGASRRGLLVAFAVVLAIIAVIAFVGTFSGGDGPAATGENAITSPVEGAVAPAQDTQPVPGE